MAESVVFVLIAGIAVIAVLVAFGWTAIDPRWVVGILAIFIFPGLYAAFTSGPFVPSARKRHKTMIKLAKIQPSDVVYDLGCGDGRLVFESAKYAKKTVGYELSVPLILWGKLFGFVRRSKAKIRFGNIWKQDYRDADVLFCYLMPAAMKKFYRVVWPQLKPGARVISNAFRIHEIKPMKEEEKVYLYIA